MVMSDSQSLLVDCGREFGMLDARVVVKMVH